MGGSVGKQPINDEAADGKEEHQHTPEELMGWGTVRFEHFD